MLIPSADATLTVIQPSNADTYIAEAIPDTNYGADDYLMISPFLNARLRALVRFDLSSIPSGSTVNVAHLSLYYYQYWHNDPANRVLDAYRVTKDWAETQATWNIYKTGNSWATAGGDYTTEGGSSSTVPSGTGQWMVWDVTAIVKAWIEGGQPNYGFIIRDASEDGGDFYAYLRSREYSDADYRPILEVDSSTPTPAPTAGPVGGVLMPANKLEILAPYLALAGLVGTVTTLLAVKKKHRD
jgi:hypothetical protein